MVNIAIMAAIPVIAVVAGLIALRNPAPLRRVVFALGALIVSPLALIGNALVLATVPSGMLSANAAWYVQIIAVPLLTIALAMAVAAGLRKIAGQYALDSSLPPVVDKLVTFAAVAVSAMVICSVAVLPLLTSPLRRIVPETAAPAVTPAVKTLEYSTWITQKNCPEKSVAAEVFKR